MQQLNVDQNLLDTQRIDPNDPQGILSQALRISAFDEFDAYNTYRNVIAKFGNVMPFSNIINSEINHYNEVQILMVKYGVEAPIVQETNIQLPNSLQECLELAIAAEIDNISLYDNLLSYVTEPDVRDLFYRIQAASYNHHLPSFRASVLSYYQNNNTKNNMMGDLTQYQDLVQDFVNGNVDQNKLMSMFSNMNMSLIGGLLVGALSGVSLNSLINKEENNETL